MANGNTQQTWPSFRQPPYAVNMPVQQSSFNPTGFQGPYAFNPPQIAPSGGGSGGGWLSSTATGAAAGSMFGPVGTAIGAGLGLLSGIVGGMAAGKKKKEARQTYEKGQKAYQSRAEQLFPELSKESFQYSNPAQSNAINAGLSFMLQNMLGNWGMPQGMNQGYGNMNQFFQNMMPGLPSATTPPMNQLPAPGPRGSGGGMEEGGWGGNLRMGRGGSSRAMRAFQER